MINVERCLGGRLGQAYPAARNDLELRIVGVGVTELASVLRAESDRLLRANPECRRVVFAAPPGDLATIAAAETAGFRYVVDVDLRGESANELRELSLLVDEPDSLAREDCAL